MPLAISCGCTAWFVSDQVRNQNIGFLTTRLICIAGMQEFSKQENFSEYFSLIAEDHELRVHTVVMATCSDYFKVMLTSQMKESREGKVDLKGIYMSRVMRKPTFWFLTRSDTNQAVQLQKMARGLKISDLESRGIGLSMLRKQRC